SIAFGGKVGVAVSVGLSLATNYISSDVSAFIRDADDLVKSEVGNISLLAESKSLIQSISAAASLAAGFGGVVGVAVSGAGADSTNIILTTTEAYADGSVIDSAADLIVNASNTSMVDALVIAASAAVSIAGKVGVGASIGAARAKNLIGFDKDGNREGSAVEAYLKDTSVLSANRLDIDAAAKMTVNAVVFAGSVAIAGGTVGVAVSGAGASTSNRIGADVLAYIDGDGASGIEVGHLTIDAYDQSSIVADTGAAAVAASFGAAGASASVGAALAENEIDNSVEAFIRNADVVTVTSGSVLIKAEEDAIIDALTAAGAAAVSISIGVSGSGAITTATNTLTSNVSAFVETSNVASSSGIAVEAIDTSTIDAEIDAYSLSVGLASLAAGLSEVDNQIGNDVSAYTAQSNLTAGGAGDIEITASANPLIKSAGFVGAVSVGIGGAGIVGNSNTTINGRLKAYVDGGALTATGDDVSVRAIATSTAEPSVEGISRGLVAVGSMNSNASIGGATQAYIAGTTSVDASRLEIAANDISSAKPITVIGGGGGLAISISKSVLEITRVTEAVIQGGADLTLISGGVDVTATSQTDGSSETTSVTVALVSIGIVTVESAVNNTTRSKIQSGATVRVPLGSVNVTTGAANTASSKIKSTSVGFVTATNSTPVAKVTSTTDASSTGQIIGLTRDSVAGNVTISATATDISVAGAETVGGGAIQVTTTNVTAETASTVNASAGGRILSGGNLTVLAVSTSDADARTESLGGGAVDITSLNATATANPGASVHVTSGSELLVTGTVTMRASAGEDPPVFADGTFQAGSAVDTVANSIRFNGNHGLVSGDTVTYNTEGQVPIGGMTNGRLYGVLNVAGSSDTLRLGVIVRSNNIDPAQTPLIDLDRDTIRFSGTHSLQDGDRVIYERGAGAIIGGLIDDKVYSVRRIDAQTIKLVDPDVTLKPPKDFTGANIQGNILTIAGHGFADNDAVTYRGPKASGFTLNQVEANGDALDSIRIEGHSFVAGDEVIYSAGDAAILGLSDGGRYFVIVDSADSVRLAATSEEATGANGATITAIEIGKPSKASLTALHSLRKVTDQLIGGLQEGVTYYVGRIDADSFRLRDRSGQIVTLSGKDGVSGTVLSGAHTLAQEGVDLTAIGSELHSLVIDLSGGGSGTQTLEGVGGALALIRGNATGMVTAAASGTGGGVVRVAGAETEAEASPTVSVMFGSDVYMLAGSIDIESLAKANVTSTAASSGGGLVSVGSSMASAITDATSTITIDGARLEAIGKIDLDADTIQNVTVYAQSNGGGLVDFADADVAADIDYAATVVLKNEASVIAKEDLHIQANSRLDLNADALTDSAGLGASADNIADIDIGKSNDRALTQVRIANQSLAQGLTTSIIATVDRMYLRTDAVAESGGLYAGADTDALMDIYDLVEVRLASGGRVMGDTVNLSALHSGIDLRSKAESDTDGLYADASAEARIDYDSENRVVAEGASAGVPASSVTVGTLNVNSSQSMVRYDRLADAQVDALGSEDEDKTGSFLARRSIDWNGDVSFLARETPVLLIGANGELVTARGITANGGLVEGQTVVGDTISVDPILNDSTVSGIVNLSVNNSAAVLSGANAGLGVITGSGGIFSRGSAFESIEIENQSDKDLVIGDISLVNFLASPKVNLSGESIGLQFKVGNVAPAGETEIKILNTGIGDVFVGGLIDNPIGVVSIENQGGSILSGSDTADRILANKVALVASGDIGTTGQRLRLDPVRSAGRATDLDANSENGGIYLEVVGRLRDTDATASDFAGGVLKAEGDVDILFQSTRREITALAGASSGIDVYQNSVYQGRFVERFSPDPANPTSGPLDYRIFNNTSIFSLVDSSYQFQFIEGYDIRLVAVDRLASDPIISLSSDTDHDDAGRIDVLTNGSVRIDEVEGDLRLGAIVANAGDVSLRASGKDAAIYDLVGGTLSTPRIIGNSVTLVATAGIGTSSNFLEIDSSRQMAGVVTISAVNSVFLLEAQGDLNLESVLSVSGDAAVVALGGSILDVETDLDPQAADYQLADIQARNIDLFATGGSIGVSGNDLEIYGAGRGQILNVRYAIDRTSVPGPGRLVVAGEDGVYLQEVSGALEVLRARASEGDIRFTVHDSALRNESLLLLAAPGTTLAGDLIATGSITAAGRVEIFAGDNVTIPSGTIVSGGSEVYIQGDRFTTDQDPTFGSTITIDGEVMAPMVRIAGGSNLDSIEITNANGINPGGSTTLIGNDGDDSFYLKATRPEVGTGMTVDAGKGADRVYLSSNAAIATLRPGDASPFDSLTGTLDGIRSSVLLNMGDSGPQGTRDGIYISSAGSSANLIDGILQNSTISGLGMTGSVGFTTDSAGAGTDVLIGMGTGNDRFRVKGAASDVVVFVQGRGGDDTLQVGNDQNELTDIDGIVAFLGEGGTADRLEVYGDASAISGQMTAIGITGMGMGRNDLIAVHNDRFGAGYTNGVGADFPGAVYFGAVSLGEVSTTVEQVDVILGSGSNRFAVDSSSAKVISNIRGGGGNDVFTVGSTTTGLRPSDIRRVDFIAGVVNLTGGGGDDTLIFEDSGDLDNANVGTFLSDTLIGLDMTGSVRVASMEMVEARLGDNTDTFYIPAVAAGLSLTVKMGSGFDTVFVGASESSVGNGSLANISGSLTIDGGEVLREDRLVLDDRSRTSGQFFDISNDEDFSTRILEGTGEEWPVDLTTVVSSGFSGVLRYLAIEDFVLAAGQGNDTVNVYGTHREQSVDGSKASTFSVKAGPGNDVVNLGLLTSSGDYSLSGFAIDVVAPTQTSTKGIPVIVHGEAGVDAIHFLDTGADVDTNLAFAQRSFAELFPSSPITTPPTADPLALYKFEGIFGRSPLYEVDGVTLESYLTAVFTRNATLSPLNISALDTESVRVSLGGGDDIVQLTSDTYRYDITVSGGDGDEIFDVEAGVDASGRQIVFNGQGGDDLVFVDFETDVPQGAVNISFNGGIDRSGSGGSGDMFRIAGDGNATGGVYRPSSTLLRSGDISLAGNSFSFTNVEPLVVHGLPDFRVEAKEGQAILDVNSLPVEDLNLSSLTLQMVTIDGVVSWTSRGNKLDLAGFNAREPRHVGQSMAVSGNTLVVGAELITQGLSDVPDVIGYGAVYVYEWNGTSWVETAKLTPSDRVSGGQGFGKRVAISGDIIVVGAPDDNSFGAESGAAYVFVRTNGVWSEMQKLNAGASAAAHERFGEAVAVFDAVAAGADRIVIGAPGDDSDGNNSSSDSVHVFQRSGSIWYELSALPISGSDDFGRTVAISGDRVAIGAPKADLPNATDVGRAVVYRRSGNGWILEGTLLPSEAQSYEGFGSGLAMDGTRVVVGSPDWDAGAEVDQGRAFVFDLVSSTWQLVARLTADGGLPQSEASREGFGTIGSNQGDSFGTAVAVSGDYVVIGAPEVDSGSSQ
ncbi:MAG: hypothetical protein ACK5AM_00370, partial [Pirellulaceae bacterium]